MDTFSFGLVLILALLEMNILALAAKWMVVRARTEQKESNASEMMANTQFKINRIIFI